MPQRPSHRGEDGGAGPAPAPPPVSRVGLGTGAEPSSPCSSKYTCRANYTWPVEMNYRLIHTRSFAGNGDQWRCRHRVFPGAARAVAAEGAGAVAATRTRADAVARSAAPCLQTDAGDGELR